MEFNESLFSYSQEHVKVVRRLLSVLTYPDSFLTSVKNDFHKALNASEKDLNLEYVKRNKTYAYDQSLNT